MMGLKPCRECGSQVSTEAKACPHCGVGNPSSDLSQTMEEVGTKLQGCGCLLTLLITLPIILVMCMGL